MVSSRNGDTPKQREREMGRYAGDREWRNRRREGIGERRPIIYGRETGIEVTKAVEGR